MTAKKELTIADKLEQLSKLQEIHSKIDEIRILKGELPIEVADLEDEIAGLETRYNKHLRDIELMNDEIADRRQRIKESQNMILKYERQLDLVKNNREFDAISKEIELCKLDIELAEKKIKEANLQIENHKKMAEEVKAKIDQKMITLEEKKKELGHIIEETEKEEQELLAKAEALASQIEDRLLAAYNRIRNNYKNGLAVVMVERDACGGCFGRIPPQTQTEIKLKKKIMICEHCGRILADVAEGAYDTEKDEYAVIAE